MKFKNLILPVTALALTFPAVGWAQDYDDDIYYNPKKEKKASKPSNYISNFQDMDVDEYNRRGQYYVSPVDTIGTYVSEGEDFAYTQQIQKFYNPTIVLDNYDQLASVLDNSYGNVTIEIEGGVPYFAPYTYAYTPYIGWNSWWGPSWSIGWNSWWGPSWSIGWNWGPAWSWGWGPSWSWNWGPAWGPGCGGWHPGHGHGPGWNNYPVANYRPNAMSPSRPSAGWSGSTRPSARPASQSHRTSGNVATGARPSNNRGTSGYTPNYGNHRTSGSTINSTSPNRGSGSSYGTGTTTHRGSGSSVGSGSSTTSKRDGASSIRNNSSSTSRGSSTTTHRSSSSSSSSRSSSSYNSGSSSHRSSGSFSGGSGSHRSSGGYSGGGSHSSGGGGGRGGRR